VEKESLNFRSGMCKETREKKESLVGGLKNFPELTTVDLKKE